MVPLPRAAPRTTGPTVPTAHSKKACSLRPGSLGLPCNEFGKPCHGLHQTLVGAVLFDHPVALGLRREIAAPDEARLAAEIFEDDGLLELHRLDVVAATMTVNDAFRPHDFLERDAVLIVAAVGAVHHETPDAARPKVEGAGRGGEAVRAPPLRKVFGIGPRPKHQIARRIKDTRPDDRTRILIEIETICRRHCRCPCPNPGPAAFSNNRRADRGSVRKSGGSDRANRRCLAALWARCGRGAIAPRGRG